MVSQKGKEYVEYPFVTIGKKLRHLREIRKLSQVEVSQALCLSVRVIEALETANKDVLPETVFVRGYLRNYANLLQVTDMPAFFSEEEKRLSPSDKQAPPATTVPVSHVLPVSIALSKRGRAHQSKILSFKKSSEKISFLKKTGNFLAKYFINVLNYIVFFSLIILIFIWWHDKHQAGQKELAVQKLNLSHVSYAIRPQLNKPLNFTSNALYSQITPWWPFISGETA